MRYEDRAPDGSIAIRSLSEQLRDLEAQFGAESGEDNDLSMPRVAQRTTLPTHLGRPIGLTRLEAFPRIARLAVDPDDRPPQPEPAPSPGAALRRGATVVGVGLLLLATTAIVPPLFLRHAAPVATQPPVSEYRVVPVRTERFAQSAWDLSRAGPATVSSLPSVQTTAQIRPDIAQPASPRPTITLAVAPNETAIVDLPSIVTDMGPTSAGSAVVIDGLPEGTRVSYGIPIARDSWTVASADVQSAVVFLPRNAPERVDLRVRVVAADSQELAANSLEIRVLRTAGVATPATTALGDTPQSTAHFEPAAAEGLGAPDAMVPPPLRKPSPPRIVKTPAWPTATSGWSQTFPEAGRPAVIERKPAAPWSAFGSQ